MQIQTFGAVCAITTFLNIWIGHVSVRAIEAKSERLWQPMAVFIIAGILSLEASTRSVGASQAVLGITGVMLLWDAFELYRQHHRIQVGHAPANPSNPRHQRLLTTFPTATTVNLLDRNIRGEAYTVEEIKAILKEEAAQ